MQYAEGNPFGQGLQDGVANHIRHFPIAVQCIDPRLEMNICLPRKVRMALGGAPVPIRKPLWRKKFGKPTGYEYEDVCVNTLVDVAAYRCRTLAACTRLISLGHAATGGLVRTRKKQPVNAFPQPQALLAKIKIVCLNIHLYIFSLSTLLLSQN
jgi:hypothetical protein